MGSLWSRLGVITESLWGRLEIHLELVRNHCGDVAPTGIFIVGFLPFANLVMAEMGLSFESVLEEISKTINKHQAYRLILKVIRALSPNSYCLR